MKRTIVNKKLLKYWPLFFLAIFLSLLGFWLVKRVEKPARRAEVYFSPPVEGEAVFYLSSELESFPVEQSFSVQVRLATVEGATNVVIATAVLNFDPIVLQVNNIEGSAQFTNQMSLVYDNDAGVITIKQGVGGGDPAVSGDIEFAVIEFEGKSAVEEVLVEFDAENSSAASDQAEYLNKSFFGGSYEILEDGEEEEAHFYLDPDEETIVLGETITSLVKLETEENVVIATAVLNFDPIVLQVNNIEGSAQFTNQMSLVYDNDAGVITIKQGVGGGDPAVSGDIEFAVIEFEGIGLSGATEVFFNEQDSSAGSEGAEYLTFETSGADYAVTDGASPIPSPSPSPSPGPSMPPGESPAPSSSPSWETMINLKIKFDGTPANNNDMNLPEDHRQQKVRVMVEKSEDGGMFFADYVDFYYAGAGIWEGSLGW